MIKNSLKVKKNKMSKKLNDEAGAALLGYSILVAVIAISTISSVRGVGEEIKGKKMCKAVAGVQLGGYGDNLWDERMWDETTQTCKINYSEPFSCIGWPCPN